MNSKDLKYYILTVDENSIRANHVRNQLNDYDFEFVTPLMCQNKQKSGSSGHMRIVYQAIQNFKPFVILEDDVSLLYEKEILEIPSDADWVYVGVSWCAYDSNYKDWQPHNKLYIDDVNDSVVRIYNMLSTHAIMIRSLKGALLYYSMMLENVLANGVAWDISLTKMQPYINCYALREPMFYQDERLRGSFLETKIRLKSGKIISLFTNQTKDYYPYNNFEIESNTKELLGL
jgi:hypothetical protein